MITPFDLQLDLACKMDHFQYLHFSVRLKGRIVCRHGHAVYRNFALSWSLTYRVL